MKSLVALSAILFLSVSSLANNANPHAGVYQNMNKAETKATELATPTHGEYVFGDNDARMLISQEAVIVHSLQLRNQGQMQHFAVASDDDKRNLRTLLDQGAVPGALVTYLKQPAIIDGVEFTLIAQVPTTKRKTLEWRAAKYSSSVVGLPGFRAKYNRTVTFTSDAKTGALLQGEIYQVSLSGLFLPQVLPLVLP